VPEVNTGKSFVTLVVFDGNTSEGIRLTDHATHTVVTSRP
jgi:hypothetical protein